jgi:hypothetical protein
MLAMNRNLLRLLWALAFAVALPRPLCAGEFDAIRESVRMESQNPEPKTYRPADDCDDEPGPFSQLLGQTFIHALISPWSAPLFLTGDKYTERGVVVPEPYRDAPFAMKFEPVEDELPQIFGRLQLDFATNFDDLERIGGQLLVETPWRLGLDTSWSNWWERQGSSRDTLQLGDANLVYRFAQSEDLQFRTGLGINWMADSAAGNVGFNFTHGFDYYPRKPWVISSTIDIGTLGHAGLFHNQTTVGYLFRRCEIFTGFEYYHIGQGELSGWINGLRWRF